jgi:[calcium/calmodulin-dependent protein kinase] kinase
MRALPAGIGFNSPLHRHSVTEENNAFELIKEEIAIMKKLHHPNLVTLIEVLDDPEEDSLYMVMEMCKKGVVMQVGLEERADPYSEEQCRCWFRDMILGLEYRTSRLGQLQAHANHFQSTPRVLFTATSSQTTA